MAHFLDCLENKMESRVTGKDAIETLKVLLALYAKNPESDVPDSPILKPLC
jgi:predicted dehydrogenase